MLKCANCTHRFSGKNYGRVVEGAVVNYCSPVCKAAGAAGVAPGNVEPVKTGDKVNSKTKRLTARAIAKLREPSEGSISKGIAGDLERRTAWNSRLQSGALELKSGHYMKFCPAGTPDRIFAEGLIVFIEVKKIGRDPAPEQVATMNTLRKNGALVFCVDNLDDYLFIMAELQKRRAGFEAISRQIQNYQADINAEIQKRKL